MPGLVSNPAIYHITHVENLPGILGAGGLSSDAERIRQGLLTRNIGHKHIKDRRLKRRRARRGTGEARRLRALLLLRCNRSVMLYVISQGHQDYDGGQGNVVHLVSSVKTAVALKRPWAFTDIHAELAYAAYFDDLSRLDEVAWNVMPVRYWSQVKEQRQAEFLVHQFFPWSAIETESE